MMLDEGFGGTTAEELVEALNRPSKLTEKESKEYVKGFWKNPKEGEALPKNIAHIIDMPSKQGDCGLKKNEDGSFVYEIVESMAMSRQQKVDKAVLEFLYEAYKDTEVSKVLVVDEEQFGRFLKEMLPIWLKRGGKAK